MAKKFYFGTNTKMYKTIQNTVDFITALQDLTRDISREEITLFVIPSFTTQKDANQIKKPEVPSRFSTEEA